MKENPNLTLERYIRARYPIIAIVSHEEGRVMRSIKALAGNDRQVCEWSLTAGLSGVDADPYETQEPLIALDFLARFDPDGTEAPTLFVFKDLHKIMSADIKVVRYLRDIAQALEISRHNLILVCPSLQIPPDLEKSVVLIDWPLPEAEELESILAQAENDIDPRRIPITLNGKRDTVVQAMRGLTEFEARSVLTSGIVATRELGESVIPYIIKEKANIIKKAGVLEIYEQPVTMDEVGGLTYLKRYAAIKRHAFSASAREAGVDAPKGVLLVGVPGTGKSLSAKAIAGGQMPLLRMDVGALMGSLVGQSESNLRAALKVAEAVAPCVLWVDEIEKALGGTGGEHDGGTSARVLGTLLTWMQETKAPVYVVATANDVRALRPELLSRFDDIAWVDLPNREARYEILSVHLRKRGYDFEGGENTLDEVLGATWGFSGREIEKVVRAAIEEAFFNGEALQTVHLLEAARRIVPVTVTMAEQIANLRAWAKDRAIPAADPLEPMPKAEKVNRRYTDF